MEEIKPNDIVKTPAGEMYKVMDIRNGEALVVNISRCGYLPLNKLEKVSQKEIDELKKACEQNDTE